MVFAYHDPTAKRCLQNTRAPPRAKKQKKCTAPPPPPGRSDPTTRHRTDTTKNEKSLRDARSLLLRALGVFEEGVQTERVRFRSVGLELHRSASCTGGPAFRALYIIIMPMARGAGGGVNNNQTTFVATSTEGSLLNIQNAFIELRGRRGG